MPTTRRIFAAAATLAVILGRVDFARGEDPAENIARRVEDIKRLIQESPAGLEKVFSPTFLAAVPAKRMTAILKDYFHAGGEVTSVLRTKSLEPLAGEYRFYTKKTAYSVTISLSQTLPHLVDGFWLGVPSPRLSKAADAVAALRALPGKVSFAVWKLGGKEPAVLASLNADEPLAIGSTFKLYILGALVKDIAAGRRRWSDVVELKKPWRSWPSGVLHTWPDGAPVTLHTLASQMISISDNTATDHLLYLLGRENVEAMVEAMGNRQPHRNRPFLSTREMFLIKNTAQANERIARYGAFDEKSRRLFVDDLAKQPRPDRLESSGMPVAIERIEWFASAADFCRAMNWLRQNTEKGPAAQARGVLSINKSLAWPDAKWRFVGFKGGSEPGVLNLTWIAQRNDDAWFVLSGGWNEPRARLNEPKFLEILQGVILTLE